MLVAVVNTSAGTRNVLRKTDKSTELLANRRHQLIHQASSPFDGKETYGGETRERCAQDYSPCSCEVDSSGKYVLCEHVSVETVQSVFQGVNDPEIRYLELYPIADAFTNTISLPLDFLGDTSVTGGIFIDSGSNYSNLVIDSMAFRSSQYDLISFTVSNCDLALQKDFNFLSGFVKLEKLFISNITNLTAFQYLPPLPSLQALIITQCLSQLNRIAFPDLSPAKLKNLDLYDNEINDQTADEIVAKLAASTSADSLEVLYLDANSLTRIPSRIGSSFLKLKNIYLSWNNISHIPSTSLTFAYPLDALHLNSNQMKTIESSAFVGKSTSARAISLLFFRLLTNRIIRVLFGFY